MKKLAFGLILFLKANLIFCQLDTINFINHSFEDQPQRATTPSEWYNCGAPGESPPDIQPNDDPFKENFFGVKTKAQHGDTYVALVTRNNSTWESISQYLESTLLQDGLYTFSLFLARSDIYLSADRSQIRGRTPNRNEIRMIQYNQPIILKVWGGSDHCDKGQLLYESPPIEHTEWIEYDIEFITDSHVDFIMFEVYYDIALDENYPGNILIDNCSQITRIYP